MIIPPLQCTSCEKFLSLKYWYSDSKFDFYRCTICGKHVSVNNTMAITTCPACKKSVNVGPQNPSNSEYLDFWVCYPCREAKLTNKTYFSSKRETKMNQFMVIKKPGTTEYHNPTRTYSSKEQAIAVAKELAKDNPTNIYCVVKIIAEAKIAQVMVEEYE